MKVLNFALIVFISFFSAFATAGETISCPDRQIGEKMSYRQTGGSTRDWSLEVKNVIGNSVEMISDTNVPVLTDRVLNPSKNSRGQVFQSKTGDGKYYQLPDCPFSLGEKKEYHGISYKNLNNGREVSGDFKVEVANDYVVLETSIGIFKAVKVTSRFNYSSGGAGGFLTMNSFYVPELGVIAKYDYVDSYDRSSATVTDLVNYKKPNP